MGCFDFLKGSAEPDREQGLMGNLFGSTAAEPEPAPQSRARREPSEADKAQLKLKIQRDKLEQARTKSEFMIEKRREAAKVLAQQGKKKQAILALKTKKAIEVNLTNTENQLMQVEQMISNIDQAGMQARVVDGLKAGNAAMKELQKQIGTTEDVENLMQETADARAYQEEISEALSGQLSLTAEDEAQLEAEMAELEEMEAMDLSDHMPDAPTELPEGLESPAPVETETQETPTACRCALISSATALRHSAASNPCSGNGPLSLCS